MYVFAEGSNFEGWEVRLKNCNDWIEYGEVGVNNSILLGPWCLLRREDGRKGRMKSGWPLQHGEVLVHDAFDIPMPKADPPADFVVFLGGDMGGMVSCGMLHIE